MHFRHAHSHTGVLISIPLGCGDRHGGGGGADRNTVSLHPARVFADDGATADGGSAQCAREPVHGSVRRLPAHRSIPRVTLSGATLRQAWMRTPATGTKALGAAYMRMACCSGVSWTLATEQVGSPNLRTISATPESLNENFSTTPGRDNASRRKSSGITARRIFSKRLSAIDDLVALQAIANTGFRYQELCLAGIGLDFAPDTAVRKWRCRRQSRCSRMLILVGEHLEYPLRQNAAIVACGYSLISEARRVLLARQIDAISVSRNAD
jgi:hypothetical protein